MTRSLPLAIETSLAVPIEEIAQKAESSLSGTDSSNTWEAQPSEAQSDDLDKLEQEIRQNSILLNRLHQLDMENNRFQDEQMLKSGSSSKNRVIVENFEADDSESSGNSEAIKLLQWRSISRTFIAGEFDVVLGVVSAVLMFILVLLVFLLKCRSRFGMEHGEQEEKQQQFVVEDAERGMLHRPEEVLRAVDVHQQTMHV